MIYRMEQIYDPSMMSRKKKICSMAGVKAYKENDAWFFRIDSEKADMDKLKELLRGVVLPYDYARCFQQAVTTDNLLDIVQQKVSLDAVKGPYKLTCDIIRFFYLDELKGIMEVTTDERGERRMTCVFKPYLIGLKRLRANIRVVLTGSLEWAPDRSEFVFCVTDAESVGESDLVRHYRDFLVRYIPKEDYERKQIYPMMPHIDKILVLYQKQGTFSDFKHILTGITDKLKIEEERIPFNAQSLIGNIGLAEDEDATRPICIIRGPALDQYVWEPFYNLGVVQTIRDAKTPILTGLGHAKEKPLAAYYADYNAATSQELATKLGFWKMASWSQEYHKRPKQTSFQATEQEKKEEANAGFFSLMKKILPW